MAGRASSGKVLNQVGQHVPWLVGGSADLGPSNNTALKFDKVGDFWPANHAGRNLHFGIREHAMGAILNGMACAACGPTGPRSSSSPTTCVRRSVWRPSWACR